MTIGVVARMKIQAGKQVEFERVFADLSAAIRGNEPGNKFYQLCHSRTDASEYIVLEAYDSDDALERHKSSAHMRDAGPKLAAVLAGRPQIEVFDAVP